MYNAFQDYLTDLIDTHIPKRTKYRQSLPPWITPSTSHQMKMLNTQKKLLENRPNSYRKNKVLKLESQITDLCEHDQISYQEIIFGSRNCDQTYKHLKHINRASNIPKTIKFKDKMTSIPEEKVEMFNTFFHSVFSAKENYNFLDIKCESPTLTKFSFSNKTISNILANIDSTKTRGPNGLPPGFYQRCGKQMINILNKLLKNIKRIFKTPTSWKTAAVTPIYKKNDPKNVENYLPISLLNIDSKIFEKCMYFPLYEHFKDHLSINQHGFLKKRSVMSNMLKFLKRIYKALDENPHDEIIAFYADFSKAFDKVPHRLLLQKLSDIGVSGCLLEIVYDYVRNRRQFVRVDFYTSTVLEKTSGVPQGSLLGPLLFCIFINDLPEVLRFSDPSIFADDLKILSVGRKQDEIQLDLNKIEDWVKQNNMELAFVKCAQINFRVVAINLFLNGKRVPQPQSVKDLGVHMLGDLSWSTHLIERLKKANKLLYSLRRNVAYNVNTFVKLGLYKSILLPVLTYGCHCANFLRKDLQKL